MEWLLLQLYGHHNVLFRCETWKAVLEALIGWNLPLLVIGDFNQVLELQKKYSKCKSKIVGVAWLAELVESYV